MTSKKRKVTDQDRIDLSAIYLRIVTRYGLPTFQRHARLIVRGAHKRIGLM